MGAGQSNHKLQPPSLHNIRFNRGNSQRIFSHKALPGSDGHALGVVGVGDLESSNPPSSFESESASVSLSHSFTLAGSASSSPTPPIETVMMLLGESKPPREKGGSRKGKPVSCGDEATGERQHHHPQPRKRAPLGFSIMPAGGVALTVYIKTPLQRAGTEDWKVFGKKAERYLAGLERQYNCSIMLFDRQSWFRGVPIRKLRIVGTNCQDVLKCKGGLPTFISENLITSEDNYVDTLGYQFHVIDKSVITLAKGAIGPDVFHNFKALLQILRSSIEKTSKGVGADEQRFHDAIMNTIAEFAKNLPDAQKIEILKFILNFDPLPSGRSNSKDYSKPMVKVLVKTMLTVATQYQTVAISNAIDSDFLRLLLHGVALDPDASIRVYVQKILHALIDRHNNAPKLLKVRIYPPEEVTNVYTREKPSRQDILFMKKTGYLLTENTFHQMLDPSNKVDNLEHLMCTIGLVALEMEPNLNLASALRLVLVELLRLVLAVQQKTTESDGSLPLPHLCAIHAVLATVMSIIVPISSLRESLQSHVQGVIKTRRERAPYLLPDVAFNRKNTQETYPAQLVISEDMLFCREAVHSALQQAALDPSSLDVPYQPFDPLKALQSLRVAMLGSSAALAAAGGGGTGSVTTPGGRTSGASEYDSTNRFSGWGTLPGSLNRGAGPGDTFRNGAQYGSRNAAPMGADSQSLSSLSMAESSQSILNAGSRASDLEKEEMISFKHAQKILYESPETRRKRKYAENMRMTSNYDTLMGKGTMDFNELCALHKERAQTRRFNMAGVFNDLSNELNRRKLSQRRTSLNTGGLSFLRGSNARNEKTDGVEMALRRSAAGSGGAAEENSGGEASEWAVDREGAAIVRETQEAKAEDTMGQGSTTLLRWLVVCCAAMRELAVLGGHFGAVEDGPRRRSGTKLKSRGRSRNRLELVFTPALAAEFYAYHPAKGLLDLCALKNWGS
ncbi:Protein EFR3 B [Echinococcus granulosus]|uniref:Protein EFR3 B n=1 Tax=Echinococcus granulosus TaxID=6210 RepID=W6VB80_ECHGR|nr:Protein EFR3 B [Echinococcus granulosus]EUB64034.1 Protein EFR3 B [Echinococcus granulosus]